MSIQNHDNPAGQQLAPATRAPKTIGDILRDDRQQAKLREVVSGGLDAQKFVRTCMAALQKTPKLQECDPLTVFGAMMTAASLGLEPNTPLQQAFLIPYKNGRYVKNDTGKDVWQSFYECQFQIGYRGFVKLAYESEFLVELQAEGIHENDLFENEQGSNTFLKFRKSLKDRGALVGAFCYLRTKRPHGEGQVVCVLPLDEVEKIRGKSQTYRTLKAAVANAENAKAKAKAQEKLAETPWVEWYDDMAAKSAIKKIIKQFPISPRVQAAAALDDLADAGKLDFSKMNDADIVREAVESGNAPLIEQGDDEPVNTEAGSNAGASQPATATVATPAAKAENTKAAGVATAEEKQPTKAAAPAAKAVAKPTTQAPDFGE